MVEYKGVMLAPNSQAYELYQEAKKKGDYKALDKHMKQLEQNERDLIKRYEKISK